MNRTIELDDDEANFVLEALKSYRWIALARTGRDDHRIDELTTRIIWANEGMPRDFPGRSRS